MGQYTVSHPNSASQPVTVQIDARSSVEKSNALEMCLQSIFKKNEKKLRCQKNRGRTFGLIWWTLKSHTVVKKLKWGTLDAFYMKS